MFSCDSQTKQSLVALISAGVGTNVWDVVQGTENPVLAVFVPDIGKWWAGARSQFLRVFSVVENDENRFPVVIQFSQGVSQPFARVHLRVVEPPVSFGFALLWFALSLPERAQLGAEIYSRSGSRFRLTTTGSLLRFSGKRAFPLEFMTPWAAHTFLTWVLNEDPWQVLSRPVPEFWRSYAPSSRN